MKVQFEIPRDPNEVAAMVMIPMFEDENGEVLTLSWPKPELRLLEGGLATELPFLAASADRPAVLKPSATQRQPRRTPVPQVEVRRPVARSVAQPLPQAVYRRRRMVLGTLAFAVLGALGLGAASLLAPAPVVLGHGISVPGIALNGYYTVQANDTFDSVAQAVAGQSPLSEVRAVLRSELGSTVVVPGERIAIP
jgi:hypothetical protein